MERDGLLLVPRAALICVRWIAFSQATHRVLGWLFIFLIVFSIIENHTHLLVSFVSPVFSRRSTPLADLVQSDVILPERCKSWMLRCNKRAHALHTHTCTHEVCCGEHLSAFLRDMAVWYIEGVVLMRRCYCETVVVGY